MPTSVGANRIAAQAEIFLTSSFWSFDISVRAFDILGEAAVVLSELARLAIIVAIVL